MARKKRKSETPDKPALPEEEGILDPDLLEEDIDPDDFDPSEFPEEEEEESEPEFDEEHRRKMEIRRKIEELREKKRSGSPKSFDNPDDYYDF